MFSYFPIESYIDKVKMNIMLIKSKISLNKAMINSKMLLNGRIIMRYNRNMIFTANIMLVEATAFLKFHKKKLKKLIKNSDCKSSSNISKKINKSTKIA